MVADVVVTVVIETAIVITRGAALITVAFLVFVALVVMVAVVLMGTNYGSCYSGTESGYSYNGFYSNNSFLPQIAREVHPSASASLVSKHSLSPSINSEE